MSEMGEVQKKSNRSLVVVLLVFVFLIIGLAIAIVIITLNKDSALGNIEEADCKSSENVDEIANCAGELMIDSDDVDEALDYYQEAINNALETGREDDAIYLVVSRSTQLAVLDEDCETSTKMYNDLDYEKYSLEGRRSIYSYALSNSIECADERGRIKWENLLSQNENGEGVWSE